jgi:hypothetical protein
MAWEKIRYLTSQIERRSVRVSSFATKDTSEFVSSNQYWIAVVRRRLIKGSDVCISDD